MRHAWRAAGLLAGWLLMGCSADPNVPGEALFGSPGADAGLVPTSAADIDASAVSITVDPLTTTTVCTDTVALRGTATPEASVYAQGGRSASDIATAHPITGRFCIDVPLAKDHHNVLEVWAKHPTLGLSTPRRVNVTQDSRACPGVPRGGVSDEPDEPELLNVAEGAAVTSKDTPNEHPAAHVTDGDPSTWTMWKGGDWWNPWDSFDGWVKVSLDGMQTVERIVVRWRDEQDVSDHADWGKKYRVLYSVSDNLGDPHPNVWLTVPLGVIQDGDGGADTFQLDGLPLRHVALWLEHNGHQSWEEAFAIAEIEVLINPNAGAAPTVEIGAETCASGP